MDAAVALGGGLLKESEQAEQQCGAELLGPELLVFLSDSAVACSSAAFNPQSLVFFAGSSAAARAASANMPARSLALGGLQSTPLHSCRICPA